MPLAFRTFTPVKDRLLVELPPRTDKVGSIFLPDRSQTVPEKGIVRACGEEVHTVQDGWTVYFNRKAGTRFQHDGKEWVVLQQHDLRAMEETFEEGPRCRVCQAEMVEGKGIPPAVVPMGGGEHSEGCHASAPPPMVLVWKCPECGHSFMK